MKGYKLTDRGKIVVTILIVVLVFLLPATILLLSARAAYAPEIPDRQDPPAIVSPPPNQNGGGITAPEESESPPLQDPAPPLTNVTSGNGNSDNSGESGNSDEQNPDTPPEIGGGIFDPTEGTMSFSFSTSAPERLGYETAAILDAFLSLPENTDDSTIAVETPRLPPDYFDQFAVVIMYELMNRGIPQQRIAFIARQEDVQSAPGSDNLTFDVTMRYITRRQK